MLCIGVPVTEESERRKVLELMLAQEESMSHGDVAEWIGVAPLVKVMPTE